MNNTSSLTIDRDWWFPRVWALLFCALVGVTFRLWCVQDDVPAVAMADWAVGLPRTVGWLPLCGILLGAVLVLARPVRLRWAWWLVAGSLCLSFAIDQHRLQPWAYQTAIYACVFGTMGPAKARRWLIPLAASVYIYSAAGKLDFQFVHSVGQDFLNVLLGPLGLADAFSNVTLVRLAFVFPIVELIAGILLLPARTRKYAGLVVMAIHLSLIMILGPWGLNHSLGVLVWNFALLVQAYFLFIAAPQDVQMQPSYGGWIASVVVLIALAAPATERAGLWDHWTSWALYSPHSSRADCEIHRLAHEKLPQELRAFLGDDDDNDGWQELQLDRWSLQSLRVPVYPQARYQLALTAELAKRLDLESDMVRCVARSAADRMNGRREEKRLRGLREIRVELRGYWLVAGNDEQ